MTRPSLIAIAVIALMAGILWMAGQAWSQMPICGDKGIILKTLTGRFGERGFVSGVVKTAGLMKLYVNPVTRTWTILLIDAAGEACIKAAGTDFEADTGTSGDPT